MSLVGLIIVLVVVGVCLTIIPIDAQIKKIVVIVIALMVVLWILDAFGVLRSGFSGGGGSYRVH